MADYTLKLETATRGYDRETCWVQARAGAIPAVVAGTAAPRVVLTLQKLRLTGSDVFYALHSMRSSDMGQTWTPPKEHENFRRRKLEDGREIVVCDYTSKWHQATGRLLGTGHTAVYQPDDSLRTDRPRQTAYSVYDPATDQWSDYRTVVMPDPEKFHNAGAGCTQRVDLENGEILLPIYFRTRIEGYRLASTVLRCAFDGQELTCLDHGSELEIDLGRGLYEPSLARFGGRYFLTMRNDAKGFVAAGDDGLTFEEPIPWRFDDGEEIGNYNTQQHWVTHSDGLFLVYTRRGLNNDHVFRHRAPLVMAWFDPARMCLLRDTERIVVPGRGARLGNFGVVDVTPNETWVIAAEWMQTTGPDAHDFTVCEKYGADNSVYAARLIWDRPNELFGME